MHPHPTHFPFLFLFLFIPSNFPQSQEPTLYLLSSFFFSFLYFPPHIQPHSPHPRNSSPWSSLFFSFSLNSTTHKWEDSPKVISLNFTKNLQYLYLFVTPKPNGNWSQIDALELLLVTQPQPCRKIQIRLLRVRLAVEVSAYCSYYFLCLSFRFSMYFVVSEMRVIWVIHCISNGNIDLKRFCFCKCSSNLSAHFDSILYISKHNFFEKASFETLSNVLFIFLVSKAL